MAAPATFVLAVVVSFTVARDGQGGSDMLDQTALTLFRAAHGPAFPAEMVQARVTLPVPVRYRLDG